MFTSNSKPAIHMNIFKSASTFFLVFALCLGGLELFLQTAEVELPYHALSPKLGKSMLPDKRIVMLKEGFYLGETNAYGYIGKEYPPERKPGTFRVALMGNSYAEGFQLFERYHYARILEQELSRRTGREVEVLNFGLGNANFHDMYLNYRNFASEFQPDLVLYVVKSENMKERNSYFIPSPYFYLDSDSLLIDYSFTDKGTYQNYQRLKPLMEHSSLFKMVQNAYKLSAKGRAPKILFDKFYTVLVQETEEQGSQDEDNAFEKDPEVRTKPVVLTEITEKIFSEIARGPQAIIVARDQAPAFPEATVQAAGIPIIFPNDTLDDLKARGIDPYYWKATNRKGHWNHEGHAAIGHFLADKIEPYVN